MGFAAGKGVRMAAGLFACCAAIFSPAITRLLSQSTLLALEEPSTLAMALIGIGTIGVYAVGKKYLLHAKGQPASRIAPPSHQKKAGQSREAA